MSDIQDIIPDGYEDDERRIVTLNPGPTHEDIMTQAARTDAQHEIMQEIIRQNNELRAQLEKAMPVTSATSKKLNAAGGEPVPHHLHLVDGRVISNHSGIGTHYSEVVNGVDVVTRVKSHYPANEPDPATLFV